MAALAFGGVILVLLSGSVTAHPSIIADEKSRTLSRERRSNLLECSNYDIACTKLDGFKCEIKDYVCEEVLQNKCSWETMKMVVHKMVEECDSNGNCQENEIQEIQERPMHRCRVERIPASICKEESPVIDCKRCTFVSGEAETCPSGSDFDIDLSATCLCELVNEDRSIITERNLLFEVVDLEEERDDLIKVLLDASADVNSRNEHGLIPLHRAAEKGYADIVRLLVNEDGAEIDAATDTIHKATPLRLAVSGDRTEAAKVLLRAGASPYFQNHFGFTALMLASQYGNDELVRLLIDVYGVDVNAPASQVGGYKTPLHFAAPGGHVKTTKLLIKAGATLDAQDTDLSTVFHRIVNYGSYSRGREATLQITIDAAVKSGNSAFLDIRNNRNKTPLHVALELAYPNRPLNIAYSYLLVEAGASLDGIPQEFLNWLFEHAVRDERYRVANRVGSSYQSIASILPNDQWNDNKEDNIEKKIPNAWNLIKLSESANPTREETKYLDYVEEQGKVTPDTCRAFLDYWKDKRDDIAADSSLDDDEKADLNEVLDDFASSK